MAKNQPAQLEPLEEETVYFIEQCQEYPYNGQWIIYSNTKYGKKMFQVYITKENALNAANFHNLNLQLSK